MGAYDTDEEMDKQQLPQTQGRKEKKKKRLDVDMESFAEVGNKMAPIVGYFPSGFDPKKSRDSDDDEDEEGDPKVRVFRSKKFSNRLQLVVSPQGSKVDFVGTNYSGEAAAAQVCTYALGVLDKDTQSLKIVPIAANKIFRLEPRLRGSHEELEDNGDSIEKSEIKVRDLTNLYGTKRDKSRIRKYDSLHNQVNPEAQKNIESKLEGIAFNKEAIEDAIGHTERNIPPHNPTASAPDKAYLLDKIISKGEWNYLSDVLDLLHSNPDAILSTKFWEDNGYPTFVCNRIRKLGEMQDEDEKNRLACILVYITHLIKFKNLPFKIQKLVPVGRSSSSKFHDIPVIFFQKFMKMFVNPEAEKLAPEKTDLLISYVLVLTLFADGFESETSDIARDLHMVPIDVRPHYEKLGCKISCVKRSHSATLPVPLKFPEMKVRRRKRK